MVDETRSDGPEHQTWRQSLVAVLPYLVAAPIGLAANRVTSVWMAILIGLAVMFGLEGAIRLLRRRGG